MYVDSGNLACPMCGSELAETKNASWSGLTDEQHNMVKPGDYYCPRCPDPEGIFEEAYFWVKEE